MRCAFMMWWLDILEYVEKYNRHELKVDIKHRLLVGLLSPGSDGATNSVGLHCWSCMLICVKTSQDCSSWAEEWIIF